ncbi:MAG: metallophosphoesterase [Clostridia bacterium]|nr:metallophosphoesterase [Clostridia bacterium]
MSSIYVISDLHLSSQVNKPMVIFGDNWANHYEKIKEDWYSKVDDDDIVLIPGDISWAMQLEDAVDDLKSIDELPGKKIIIKGNHDYWWSSYKKVKSLNLTKTFFIQNNAIKINNYIFFGTRGWEKGFENENSEKIYEREVNRLGLSLLEASKLKQTEEDILIGLMHFPPYNNGFQKSEFTEQFSNYNVKTVVYGHLHNLNSNNYPSMIIIDNTKYFLTSCDYLDFKLMKIF